MTESAPAPLGAFFHHLAWEVRTGIRDRARLLMLYLFPLVFTVLMGGLMGQINPLFKERMIPAMAVFTLMCTAFLSLPSAMVQARSLGVWRSFKINGVPRMALLTVPVLALGIHGLVVTVLIVLLGAGLFGAALPVDLPLFLAAWLASWVAISSLGTLIGTVSANERVALLLSQALYIPSIMLGGLMMPESLLNDGMRAAAQAFPATHAMKAFGPVFDPLAFGILGAITLVAWILTFLRFRWD